MSEASKSENPEEWRDVAGYEGIYQVSSYGRVMRIAKGQGARAGHILKPGCCFNGYLIIALCRDGIQRTMNMHRVVAEAFLSRSANRDQVNHKNGVRDDNRVENLEWVTNAENQQHAYRELGAMLTHVRGEKHCNSKLTRVDVKKIRHLYATGDFTQQSLGEMFGVHKKTIYNIVYRKSWQHVS